MSADTILREPRALFGFLMIVALATYLLRAVPFVLLRRPFRNRYAVALLEYMPYALLSAMIFPAIFYSTGGEATFPGKPPAASLAGAAVSIVLGFCGCSLPLVAGAATAAAYLVLVFL